MKGKILLLIIFGPQHPAMPMSKPVIRKMKQVQP